MASAEGIYRYDVVIAADAADAAAEYAENDGASGSQSPYCDSVHTQKYSQVRTDRKSQMTL
jgi:hypothetical protein